MPLGNSYFMPNSLSYPFITKQGNLNTFKTVSVTNFNEFAYGDTITGSYPLTASISSDHHTANNTRRMIEALRNTLEYYRPISPHYAYSSSLGDKSSQELRLLSIPSIFYGSSIEPGTVSCKWYVTGTLIAELNDENKNGDLVQVGPSGSNGSGSVAGSVLYREGFVILTGSWSLDDTYTDVFDTFDPVTQKSPRWYYFLTTGSGTQNVVPSSSFGFTFNGTNYIPTITMLARAFRGELNHSNNPTYIKYGQTGSLAYSSSFEYVERDNTEIKSIVDSPYTEDEPKFEKTTYVSKIGIYDDKKNLIGVAKLATPVRKREIDSYTFKLKVDF